MRDYSRFDERAKRLTGDIYAQPPDPGHTAWAVDAMGWALAQIFAERAVTGAVLDVGCGQGFMCEPFERAGLDWTGVAIGADVEFARAKLAALGLDQGKVREADMTFLPFEDKEFDLIFARHVLEHSPFPIITLMEWRRVVGDGGHLCLVVPAPHWWGYRGRNHYSIVPLALLKWWCMRAGWAVLHEQTFDSRAPLFLEHLEVYQAALKHGRPFPTGAQALENYPQGPVEYRLICRAAEEIVE